MLLLTTSTFAGLAGALSLASASPITAAAAPVSVVSCDYSVVGSATLGLPELTPFQVGNLRITFVNQAPLAATNVRFAVRYADRTQIIDDAGTFATGTPVTQDFSPATNAAYGGSAAACSVEAVTFADGSTWQPA
jgi:hypothetical protein